jgi:hypothetical protein
MAASGSRRVHIFHHSVLLTHLTTTESTPAESYVIDGKRYEVTSYLSITEADGTPGFDVQVEASGADK